MPDLTMIVSEGTLRPQDVIPKMIDAYKSVADTLHSKSAREQWKAEEQKAWLWQEEADALIQRESAADEREYSAKEDSDIHEAWDALWSEVEDGLNEVVGHEFYFGTSEGDGACFGIWPVA